MTGVIPKQDRRFRDLEAKVAKEFEPREPRTRSFFRDKHQTDADMAAEIDAARRSGWLRPGDRCIIYRWGSPDKPPAS